MKIVSDAELFGWKLAVWILFAACAVLLWKVSSLSPTNGTRYEGPYPTDTVYVIDTVHDIVHDTVPYYQTRTVHDTVYDDEITDEDVDFNESIIS